MSIITLDSEQLNKKIFDYFNKYNTTLTDSFKKDKKILESLTEAKSKKKSKKIDKITVVTGDNKKLVGSIQFKINNIEKTLTFLIISGKTIYKEDLYLPIYISLNDTINKIKQKIESINNEILEFLEYGDIDTSEINIQSFKLHKFLLEKIELISSEHKKELFIKKNNLMKSENTLLKQNNELYKNISFSNTDTLEEYFLNYFKLEQTNLNSLTPILKGTNVYYQDEIVQIQSIEKGNKKYVLVDGRTINFTDVKIIPSIRNLIYNYKLEEDLISLDKIVDILDINEDLLHLLLEILDINIDMNKRPYIVWSYISKEEKESIFKDNKKIVLLDDLTFSPVISSDLLYTEKTPILIGTSKNYPFEYKNIGDKCRFVLSLQNTKYNFQIDDFTFLSPLHYVKAAQYYNRQDLIESLRGEYNDFYLHFTKEYKGIDSLYDLSLQDLNNISQITTLRKYYLWDKPNKNSGSSIYSLYFRKALYHFIHQNKELSDCLLSTEDCILYEKVKKYTFRVYYELMEIRYFIKMNEVPFYANYNYDNKLRMVFDTKQKIKIDIMNKTLIEVIIETDSYKQRYNYLDLPNPIEPILLAYKMKDNIKLPNSEMIYNILFSYESDYYYNLVVTNKGISFEKLLLSNPQCKDNLELLSFIYILANYLEDLNDENTKKQILENEERIKKLQSMLFQNQKREIDKFRLLSKSHKLIPDNIVFGLNNSLYQSIGKNLIRQNKYPLNHSNVLDTRSKLSNKTELIQVDDIKISIYPELEQQLSRELGELYSVNNSDMNEITMSIIQLRNIDYELQLELFSRFLAANITVISNDNIQSINYVDMRIKYPNITSSCIDYIEPNINIIIGKLANDDNIFYVDLLPDFSQKDAIIDYLYDNSSNMILKELDDNSQEYIGIWDPIELKIKYNEPMPEISEENLDMEVLRFILIGQRLYYGQTELV